MHLLAIRIVCTAASNEPALHSMGAEPTFPVNPYGIACTIIEGRSSGASEFGPFLILTNAQTLNCQDSKLCLSP
jgi:hypothetical protein